MLPTKGQLFAQGLFQGRVAYKKAKENASKGYDPSYSAFHAQRYSMVLLAFWLYVPVGSFLSACIFPVSLLWNVPLGFLLWRRLQAFKVSPPDQRLRYGIPTGLLITLYTVGIFVSGLGWIITLATTSQAGVQ
jgi:hypothetical protein